MAMENMNQQVVEARKEVPMIYCHQVIDLRLSFDITMKLNMDARQILRLD